MTKDEVIAKLKTDLTLEEKIEIFKWGCNHYSTTNMRCAIVNSILKGSNIKFKSDRDKEVLEIYIKSLKKSLHENKEC